MTWQPVAFRCTTCGTSGANPEAIHPRDAKARVESFRAIVNVSAPTTCADCHNSFATVEEQIDATHASGRC